MAMFFQWSHHCFCRATLLPRPNRSSPERWHRSWLPALGLGSTTAPGWSLLPKARRVRRGARLLRPSRLSLIRAGRLSHPE